jgi:hypothetical protein
VSQIAQEGDVKPLGPEMDDRDLVAGLPLGRLEDRYRLEANPADHGPAHR